MIVGDSVLHVCTVIYYVYYCRERRLTVAYKRKKRRESPHTCHAVDGVTAAKSRR